MPPEALPPALKRKFDDANANKRIYRRASSSMGPERAGSRVEWDDNAGRKAAGAKVVPK